MRPPQLQRLQPNWHVQTPPINQSNPPQSPGTSDCERNGKSPLPRVFSAEPSAPGFRAQSNRSPTRSARRRQILTPTEQPPTNAIALHRRSPLENRASPATARTRERKSPIPLAAMQEERSIAPSPRLEWLLSRRYLSYWINLQAPYCPLGISVSNYFFRFSYLQQAMLL